MGKKLDKSREGGDGKWGELRTVESKGSEGRVWMERERD